MADLVISVRLHDDASILIGSHTAIGLSCHLNTSTHLVELSPLDPDNQAQRRRIPPLARSTVIGEHVWLCANVTINPGARIGDGSVVAAGAVVTKDVEAGVLVGGVSAKVLRRLELDVGEGNGEGERSKVWFDA